MKHYSTLGSMFFCAGFFMCSVAHSAVDEWDPEDNVSPGTTLSITSSEQLHGPHTLDYTESDNYDWFEVSLVAGQRYRFETTGTADIDAWLYSDTTGTVEVASDADNGDGLNFELVYVPSASGTYYLKTQYFANSEGLEYAAYNLLYQSTPVLDAWDPDDDSYSTATTVIPEASAQTHGPHYLSEGDTVDWFHAYLEAGRTYTFEATGGWDTVGTLYYNNPANEVAYNDASFVEGDEYFSFSITYTPDVDGDYFLSVANYFEGEDLEYSLRYLIGGGPDSDGDGMSDADEAVAGTNPDDDTSFFAITNWSPGSFIIEWPAYSGREYQVYWTDHLTNGFQQLGPVIDYPQNSYTDTIHHAESSGFYKVDVRLK